MRNKMKKTEESLELPREAFPWSSRVLLLRKEKEVDLNQNSHTKAKNHFKVLLCSNISQKREEKRLNLQIKDKADQALHQDAFPRNFKMFNRP